MIKMGVYVCRNRVARHGRGVGGCRALGIRRGQRCVRSMQSPVDGLASLEKLAPWGLRRSYALRGMGF